MADSKSPHRFLWHPITGYALAVIVAVIWFLQPEQPKGTRTIREAIPYPAAIIDVQVPQPNQDTAIFWSPTTEVYLMMRGKVSPQGEGHHYSIELTYGPTDSSLIFLHDNWNYDSLGNVVFATLAPVGDFKLKVYDYVEADTTTRVHPFAIRYEAP